MRGNIKKFTLMLAVLPMLMASQSTVLAAESCANCPPAYCENPSVAAGLKAKKKAAAEARGLPTRLSVLFDRLADCSACVQQAPDWPSIIWVQNKEARDDFYGRDMPSGTVSMAWSADNEMKARNDMREGLVKSYHVVLETRPCTCCQSQTPEEYKKWIETGGTANGQEFDKDKSINVDDVQDLKEDPKDLTELAPVFRKGPPAPGKLEDFVAPSGIRVMQVMCKECQGAADRYNEIGEQITKQHWHMATIKRDIAHDEAMIKYYWNRENGLNEVAQTKEVIAQFDQNKKERDRQYQLMAKSERALKSAEARLKELEASLETQKKRVAECEETGCKTKTLPVST